MYFNAKILDYALGSRIYNQNLVFKGIFLSTAKIKDNAKCYALAYGIVPVDPFTPPVEYMISSIKEDDPLRDDLIKFKRKISPTQPESLFISEINGKELLKEHHYYYKKFKAKGYE